MQEPVTRESLRAAASEAAASAAYLFKMAEEVVTGTPELIAAERDTWQEAMHALDAQMRRAHSQALIRDGRVS